MWRHEDVWRTLGGGIDFVTGERIEDEYQLSRVAAESRAAPSAWSWPRSCTAPRSGAPSAACSRASPTSLLPRFDPHLVWGAVERYGIGVVTITGDAMARPLIEALQERDAYDTSSLVAISSTAAVFSPVVKDQLFELLPNVFISEAVGSSEGGFNGMRLVEKGADRHRRRPHQRAARPRLGDHRRRRPARAARRGRAPGPRRQRARSATTRTRSRPPSHVHRGRGQAPLGARRLRPARARRHHDPARPGLAVHQLRRREDLPRRGGVGAEGPPQGVRRARHRRRRRALGPDGRRRGPAPARRGAHARRAGRALPHPARPLQGAARSCTSWTRCPASPAASPTTSARPSAGRTRRPTHERTADRDVRDRVPDLRLLPLPGRGRRGHQRRRHGRARRPGVLARGARDGAQLDRRARQRPALRRRRGDAGEDGRPRRAASTT